MFGGQLLLFLLITVHPSSCAVEAVYDAGREIWKFYLMIDSMKLDTPRDSRIYELLSSESIAIRDLKYQIKLIHREFRKVEEALNSKNIRASSTSLPSDVMVMKSIDSFELFIQSIDDVYEEFYGYIIQSSSYTEFSLQALIDRIFVHVPGYRERIHNILVDSKGLPDHKNLVSAIAGYAIVVSPELCNGTQMMSNLLIHLFNIAIIAEMKSNIMLAFVNIYDSKQIEELKRANLIAREQLEERFGSYVNIFAENLRQIDGSYMRACDPINGTWIRGQSFHELAGVFQATIFRYHWAQCKFDSCETALLHKSDRCDPSHYDLRSSCSNAIGNCTYLNAIKACVLKSGPHKFQYVESKDLGLLGQNLECPKNNGYMIEDGRGWNFSYSACACNCYGDNNKISLLMWKSRVESNMIITGLRFINNGGILYIQPREGKLGANGYIKRYTQKWMPIPNNIDQNLIHVINTKNRIFFFDDLRLPAGFVLTGIQFIKLTRRNLTGFAINIVGLPFNHKSGKLSTEGEIQIFKQDPDTAFGKGLSFKPTSSAYTTLRHTLSPGNIKYVSLKQSSLQDDFGQSTLPLFDAIPITLQFPSALGGVGIFHKGVEGYAGFISLRVYGIKYAQYFDNFKSDHMINDRVSFNDSHSD